jgi:8-amino-7-oxononanoate synthase
MTYAQLDRRARAIAECLQDMRLSGQRVVIAYPPGLEFIAAFFGTLYAGCVAVPTYQPRHRTLDRFHALAANAGAAVALSTTAAIAQIKTISGSMASLPWLATDELAGAHTERWSEHDPAPNSLAMIQYTSGSTNRPKGVMLSHANLAENTAAVSRAFEITRRTSSVFWLPTYHDLGLIGGILTPVYSGRPSTVMAPAMFLQNPFLWLQAISTSHATISGGPNFAYELCLRKITVEQRATLDLSSWSLAFVGAEIIQPATLARFAESFARCGFSPKAFYPCYGLAEATLMVTGARFGAGATTGAFAADALAQNRVERLFDNDSHASVVPLARRLVSCGTPVGSLQVAIVDADTAAHAAPDRVGEVWVAGNSVGQGYWRDPQKTSNTFHARLRDSGDGPFLRTGDLGFIHENQLYITGRIDDLIILRGCNHHPQDIEATARESHSLLKSGLGAAFAVDDAGTQRLVLVHEVERLVGSNLTSVLTAVRAAVLEMHGLSIDAVVLIRCGTIAKTSSGKVQRHASRAAFLANTLKPLAQHLDGNAMAIGHDRKCLPHRIVLPTLPGESAALAAVCQHALALSGIALADVTPETPISALGLDSLQRVELVAALDKSFGRHLPDSVYCRATSLGDLASAVQKHLIDRPQTVAPALEVPADSYDIALFPEYLELKRHERMMLAVARSNPYFRVDQGDDAQSHRGAGHASRVNIDGRVLTNLCAYDYLSMAHDPTVIAMTKVAIDRYGTGASASRLVSGEKQIHRELERALAEFLGTPASIVFVSGHATNVTTIGHLMSPGDLIVHDVLAHNSILQGARLSGATCRGFAHNDWRALDSLLASIRRDFRRVLIAIEGVYSMDGDHPDLARFVEVKKKHRAMLLVDEAHSLGTMGQTGRGIGEHANIDRADVELWMGTLSKSLASCGGYIAGSAELIEYLKYTAPGFVYSVGIAPSNAASALAALSLLQSEPQRVARLRELSALFLALARDRGLDTGLAGESPVIPVIIGNSVKCLLLSRALFERGINIQPILHRAVPEHATRLRSFITTNLTESNVRSAVDAIAEELARQ